MMQIMQMLSHSFITFPSRFCDYEIKYEHLKALYIRTFKHGEKRKTEENLRMARF